MELEYSIRFDSFLSEHLFTSQTAKEAAKHVGKAALEAGKTVAVDYHGEKSLRIFFICFDTIYKHDIRTDGRTDRRTDTTRQH